MSRRPLLEWMARDDASLPNSPGFSRIDLLALVLTALVLVGCLTPPSDELAGRIQCNNNLKQVGLAFKTWSLDADDTYPTQRIRERGGTKELIDTGLVAVHFRVLSNELSMPKVLVCPADKMKRPAGNFDSGFSDLNVSYFLGVDAHDIIPQALLSGDRNLGADGRALSPGLFSLTTNTLLTWTPGIHGSCGNVLLADGSVQFIGCAQLSQAARNQGLGTNRLAIP